MLPEPACRQAGTPLLACLPDQAGSGFGFIFLPDVFDLNQQ